MCSSLVRDPYDDGVMDDFGDFGDFGVKGAIEAAWAFVQDCIDSDVDDVDEDEFRKEFAENATWVLDGDEGEHLLIELCKTAVK